MKLAYVMTPQQGATDRFLTKTAQRLLADGVVVAGLVQRNTPRPKTHHCDMDVQVLPDGAPIRISKNLGLLSRGCSLNPHALEGAVLDVAASLRDETQVLIINKFGKHEAEGRGFRFVIAEALERGIPVIIGLSPLNAEAFGEFSGGMAEPLALDAAALDAWLHLPKTPRVAIA